MIKMLGFFIGISTVLAILTFNFQGAQAGVVTTTTAALDATDTAAVGVNNITGFKSAGILVLGNEIIRYTGTDTAGNCPAPVPASSPCFTGLERSIGEIAAGNHPTGTRLYDETTGLANLEVQHSYSAFTSELETGSALSLNPFTWKDALTSRTANFIPTFLTGNWTPILWIFIFFQFLLVLMIAFILISILRGVTLI